MIRATPVCVVICCDAHARRIRTLYDARAWLHALAAPETDRAVDGFPRRGEMFLDVRDSRLAMRAFVLTPLSVTVTVRTIIATSALPHRIVILYLSTTQRAVGSRASSWASRSSAHVCRWLKSAAGVARFFLWRYLSFNTAIPYIHPNTPLSSDLPETTALCSDVSA